MPELSDLRRPPARDMLVRLAGALAPGGRIRGVRLLRGGIDAGTHAFDLVTPAGGRLALVLRRYPDQLLARDPGRAARAYRTLGLLAGTAIPAPRPVLLDANGTLLGAPGYVMTRLPGRVCMRPPRPDAWLSRLAVTAAAIHRAPVTASESDFLRPPEFDLDHPEGPAAAHREAIAGHPDGHAVAAALRHWAPRVRRPARALVHGDYWAGNTLWVRGRLTGVVDWDWAGLDYPPFDVGYCRLDLALFLGGDAPDRFLAAYETAAGTRVADLFFWDLLGVLRALPDPAVWLPGYHDLGLFEITAEDMRARLRAFIADALDRAR
jgi:aminoglycoside phosphotransferase (APT) family kinase protein